MAQKYYHSGLAGAPVLTGAAGSLISVIDAVNDGWGTATATSLVVSGGIATATFSSPHDADVDITVRVAGATPSGLNGDWMLTAKGGSTISWPTAVADGAATGTITVKIAPLGLLKAFTGAGKAVYKSTAPSATGFCLRVDDTGTTSARVVAYESMTDVDTGTNAFPTAAQVSGGMFWNKSATAGSTAIPWEILGDERGFYFMKAVRVPASSTYLGRDCNWFGDINNIKSADAYACVLVGSTSLTDDAGGNIGWLASPSQAAVTPSYVARSLTQIGTSARGYRTAAIAPSASATSNVFSGGTVDACFGTYPAAADLSARTTPIMFSENPGVTATDSQLRGLFPGAYSSLLRIPGGTFSARDTIDATGDMAGKKLLVCPAWSAAAIPSSMAGAFFLDIKGAWR
ncbi:hypothetical protein [Variovorax sp. EBFNA2]|uniref:hypothetical protein n=1 Tax=Variovorax sp. EBFNA2 TaxID=3342097 RepID=UPI0029C07E55|nr:hypothetical protein [Variovorax boronicumulans]WPG35294.1 hypothetical protein RZE79_17560 [Variovorax boronicumulans]